MIPSPVKNMFDGYGLSVWSVCVSQPTVCLWHILAASMSVEWYGELWLLFFFHWWSMTSLCWRSFPVLRCLWTYSGHYCIPLLFENHPRPHPLKSTEHRIPRACEVTLENLCHPSCCLVFLSVALPAALNKDGIGVVIQLSFKMCACLEGWMHNSARNLAVWYGKQLYAAVCFLWWWTIS